MKKFKGIKNHITSQLKKEINRLTHHINKFKVKKSKQYRHHIHQRIEDSMIGDSRTFYQLYYQATDSYKSQIPPLKDKNGKIIAVTSKEKANKLLEHFNRDITENQYSLDQNANTNKYNSNMIPTNVTGTTVTISSIVHGLNRRS